LRASFQLHLRAENKSTKTLETYSDALDQLTAFLERTGMPREIGSVRREHVEAFLVSLQEAGRSPATVNNRYRGLQAFFRWLTEEGEVRESAMARMRPPKVPQHAVPILSTNHVPRVVANQNDARGLDRNISSRANGYTDIGLSQRRSVIHAVADHRHFGAT
jgi:site-specific recombinase XerD